MIKLLKISIFFMSFNLMGQYNENYKVKQRRVSPFFRTGLLRLQLGNKVYNFNRFNDLGRLSRKSFEISSAGVSSQKYVPRNSFLPFEIEIVVDDKGNISIDEYEASLFQSIALDENGNFTSSFSWNVLNIDREEFRATGRQALRIDRFNLIQAEYRGSYKVGSDKVKLVFGGKIGIFPATFNSQFSDDLKLKIRENTGTDIRLGDNASRIIDAPNIGSIQKEISETPLNEVYKLTGKMYEGFLGDAEFMVGFQLFRFLETRLGISRDLSAGYLVKNDDGVYQSLFMDSVKRKLDIELDLSRAFPGVSLFHGLSLYGFAHSERLNLQAVEGDFEAFLLDPVVSFEENTNASIAGVGLRVHFGGKKKSKRFKKYDRYKDVIKPIF